MNIEKKLIEKYNRPGPRYTSYPPVPFWNNPPDETTWIRHIQAQYDDTMGMDLYVHVPFCEKLCFYCGCSRIITKDHNVEDPYLNMVMAEWTNYQKLLGFSPKINSLHFGGGTPTFLSPQNLHKLITHLTNNRSENFVGSIEIDPRTCSTDHLKVLSETGITRVSLGIQDFDEVVQKTINRHQPVNMVDALMNQLRKYQFKSINFDLIYGLPKQSLQSISTTIEIVSKMRPDLIAFYGYAHLPEKIKNQRLIQDKDLPSAELRRELYESGKKILGEAGYDDIGMDHFALPGSYLYEAKKKQNLHRNFMGYVDKKSSVLLGLGPTSISDSGVSFAQNAKDLKLYEKMVTEGRLPIMNGHIHTTDDLLAQEIILNIMCEGKASFDKAVIPSWNDVKEELKTFQDDGILRFSDDQVELSELGKPFLRNVAMAFDFRLRNKESSVRFSQTV